MFYFYKQLFKLTSRIMKKNDKKSHKHNDKKYEDIRVEELSYLNDNLASHRLDIVYRPDEKKHPLLFDIHGGGWFYGDHELNRSYASYFAEQGFVVSVPSYNLILKNPMEMTVKDVHQALLYTIKNADKFNIDTGKIFMTGDSAGAAILVILLAIYQSPELQKIYGISKLDIDLKGIVLTHPVVYISEQLPAAIKPGYFQNAAVKTFNRLMYGKTLKNSLTFKNSSFEDIGKYIKNWPPTLITTSTGDASFYKLAIKLYDEIKDKATTEKLIVADDSFGHVHNILNPEDKNSREVNEKVVAFLSKCLY